MYVRFLLTVRPDHVALLPCPGARSAPDCSVSSGRAGLGKDAPVRAGARLGAGAAGADAVQAPEDFGHDDVHGTRGHHHGRDLPDLNAQVRHPVVRNNRPLLARGLLQPEACFVLPFGRDVHLTSPTVK